VHYRELNRQVALLKMVEAVDTRSGEVTSSVATSYSVWAQVTDVRTSELTTVSAQDGVMRCVFTIRYRDDVDRTWRVADHRGKTWMIDGEPEEVGRRQFLKLYCVGAL
jgi:SPP1 family predicted phage head-tail adaptor